MELQPIETNQVENANQSYKSTLKHVLTKGVEIKAETTKSIGSDRKFKEVLNYNMIIHNPVQRLITDKKRSFRLPGAIARFIWMMAANNRLADIEFYWGKSVAPFTDDGYTVPGSSYGARMFNASPGLDQIEAIIKRLKEDHSTRRAAVSIYHPIDAIRDSKDIPCTFGLFYHIRGGKLVSTVVMRSNNAYILLPYNTFEFSLLSEIIAKEVGVEMGSMHYNALSMHIYEEHYSISEEIVNAEADLNDISFPPMPFDPKPMDEVKKLIRLEAKIRHISAGLNNSNIGEWLKDTIILGEREEDKITLHEYWKQFYYLLLYFIVSEKINDKEALKKVTNLITDPYKKYLNEEALSYVPKAVQQDLFGNIIANPAFTDYSHVTRKLNSLESLCDNHNKEQVESGGSNIIDFSKYIKLREKMVGNLSEFRNIAARSDSPEISKNEFLKTIEGLFSE
jgi:thymidylate synthase